MKSCRTGEIAAPLRIRNSDDHHRTYCVKCDQRIDCAHYVRKIFIDPAVGHVEHWKPRAPVVLRRSVHIDEPRLAKHLRLQSEACMSANREILWFEPRTEIVDPVIARRS